VSRLLLPALLSAVWFSARADAAPAGRAAPAPAAAAVAPAPGLVVARTGAEDPATLSSAFRHAAAAQASGHLPAVTVVVYGRAIQVFQPGLVSAEEARNQLGAARAAGVRVLACRQALERHGIPVAAGHALLPY